jgi:UDP-N-acetylmuramoylalanine--D-glutamate ligase
MDEKQAALRQIYLSDDGARYPLAKAVADAIRSERTICVLGFGISNRPLVGVLLGLGARVCVYDQKGMDALGEQAAVYFSAGVKFVHTDEAWLQMKPAVIFRSPGIRPDIPPIVQAVEQGATLGGEMDWLLERTPATVIAITGSDGKARPPH